jgi:hypothetical protein
MPVRAGSAHTGFMPSLEHEALLELLRNQPALAAYLLRVLKIPLPAFTRAQIDSADLTSIQPAEYRADIVIRLLRRGRKPPVMGIVAEVQLSPDARKPYVWAAYVANLCVRLGCPVCLLVITTDRATARWAAKGVDLGGGNHFAPVVIDPSGVPVVTSKKRARENPELAVLSAMAHCRVASPNQSLRIALAAFAAAVRLDDQRSRLYFDLILQALPESIRKRFQAMALANYEYQSDFAKKYFAQGREEGLKRGEERGRTEGRVALLREQLTLRFGPLPKTAQNHLASASIEQLDAIGKRLLSAKTLDEVFASN